MRPPAKRKLLRSLLLVHWCSRAVDGRSSRQDVVDAYKPHRRHPQIFDAADGWRQWLDPPLLEALDAQNATALRSLLREEVGEVYSFRMMSDDFCRMFLEELDHYYSTGLPM